MNSARPLPKSPSLKPPPLPKALAVVPPPARLEASDDDPEVTAVDDAPPEILRVAESDVRELRVPRPLPPRPAAVPRPGAPLAKKRSVPPPLPAPVARESDVEGPLPEATSSPAPRPEGASALETGAPMKPRPFALVRTAWFFGVFVTTDTLRSAVDRLSRARAWFVTEWKRAAARARAPRPE
jgi:hypothetical protein